MYLKTEKMTRKLDSLVAVTLMIGSLVSHIACSEQKMENDHQMDDPGKSLLVEHSWDTCNMKSDRGTKCKDWSVRWYFDSEGKSCQRFWYGGCDGNENNFESEMECKDSCHAASQGTDNIVITEDDSTTTATNKVHTNYDSQGICRLNPDQGYSRSNLAVKWYYHHGNNTCYRFWYEGLGGNGNRFENETICLQTCYRRQNTEEETCSMPPMTGRDCKARMSRYYYDKSRGECLQFIYGGCGGNNNNFQSKADCERECRAGSSALGDQEQDCRTSRYGCCSDGVTKARGDNQLGCPHPCKDSEFGCCPDGVTPAQGTDEDGCEDIDIVSGAGSLCDTLANGCCPDGVTPAKGPYNAGCDDDGKGDNDDRDDVTLSRNDVTVSAICGQPKDSGPCRDDMKVMWYYDTNTNRCDRFWYGCQGNSNRFKSEKECLTMCTGNVRPIVTTPTATPVCRQERVQGPCRASLPRYFYNYNTGYCEQFSYGGCQGNDNNFASLETCIQTCNARRERELTAAEVCRLPRDQGSCENNRLINVPLPSLMYFYNSQTGRCEEFQYNGCGGNRNRFGSEQECRVYCRVEDGVTEAPRRQSVCELTPDLGPCNRMVSKYFYNITTMQCEPFTYGGCLGNHNNFQSDEKCMSYCGLRQSRSTAEDCRLPSETGPCRGNFLRWFYDPDTRNCRTFRYGGCQGNRNNFATDQECTATCLNEVIPVTARPPVTRAPTPAAKEEDVCTLPLVQPCDNEARVADWGTFYYYNVASGECVEVPGGTCNNNRNNFYTRDQCEAFCNRDKVCQPLTYNSEVRCLAYMERWTYTPSTDACEQFVYGGCGGSANRFDTQVACERKCRRQLVTRPVSTTSQPRQETRAEVCAMPEEGGNCLAYIQNWRYDSTAGNCVQFVYGGCGGNSNNFKTKEECERFCSRQVVCQRFEEPEVSCLANIPRWRYNPDSRTCENFVYGGCGGNANNFNSIEACEGMCLQRDDDRTANRDSSNRVSSWEGICRLQADVGPCKSSQTRWHYNPITQLCETFTYGGCLGNHNNFESQAQCMTYCDSSRWAHNVRTAAPTAAPTDPEPDIEGSGDIDEVITGVDVCSLDRDSGSCRFASRKWFYNHREGKCEEFVYGGCEGNQNRFESREECESQCNPRDICMLSSKTGICRASIPRFYFDYAAQECRQFVYGGCQGNANNFDSRDVCMARCSSLLRDRPEEPKVKAGYCPPRTDWKGLLGACAPACSDDSSCPGQQKCCHHGCGVRCVDALDEEPYKMRAPVRIEVTVKGPNSVEVRWYDPTLAADQLIRDRRYYTVRYHSFSIGQYVYVNVTDMPARIENLRAATDYKFTVRVNDPPYLSEWSEEEQATTASQYITKAGECPAVDDDTAGICVEECRADGDCDGAEKCCSNGCGKTCMRPTGYDVCSLLKDPGSCGNWTVRWYYNREEAQCDRFWFSQCGGNDNRFMTEAECLNRCVGTPVTTPRPTQPPRTPQPRPSDCRLSVFNCCEDGYTSKLDAEGTNCPDYVPGPSSETVVPVTPGEKATLTCRYGSSSTWYHDGKLVVSDNNRRVNSDGTLEILKATIDDDGMYACHVARATGQQIYRFLLQVQVPIGVLPGPDTIMVKPSSQAFLHCEVYGNPKPSVSWTKNGSPLRSSSRYETFSNGTLLIRSATPGDADSYTCRADNGVSTPVDRTIKLSLREMLVARIENQNGRVIEGGRILLNCEGKGYPEPAITWEKAGRALVSGGNVFISSNGGLTIRDATSSDTGTYTCIVSNTDEKIETSTSVQVVPKVMPDDKCEDKTSLMKCRLIVSARLCGYTMYSKICCNSCQRFFNGE